MKNKIIFFWIINFLIIGGLLLYVYMLLQENTRLSLQWQQTVFVSSQTWSAEVQIKEELLSESTKNAIISKDSSADLEGYISLPEKNIYCNTWDIQYALNLFLLENYSSWLEEAIAKTEIIPSEYKEWILEYLQADDFIISNEENPLEQIFYHLQTRKKEVIELIEKSDFVSIREIMKSLDLPPNIEASFILFSYKNEISQESVESFMDNCYTYTSDTKEYNYDLLKQEVQGL